MKIGEAAARINLPSKTVRCYEQIGLLGSGRREDGFHDYAEKDVHEPRFVSRAHSLGFTVDECGRLLLLYRETGRFSGLVRTLARAISRRCWKIAELRKMERRLETLVRACQGDERPESPIVNELFARAAFPRNALAMPACGGPRPPAGERNRLSSDRLRCRVGQKMAPQWSSGSCSPS